MASAATLDTWITINYVLAITLLILIVSRIYIIWEWNKKRTYALILSRDKTTQTTRRVDLSKPTFVYNKGAYNVVEPWITYGRKRFILYEEGKADPIDVFASHDTRIPASTYKHILDNEVIKALNKPSFSLFGLQPKQLIIGLIVLAVLWYLASGGRIA